MIALLHVLLIVVAYFGQIGCQHALIPRNKFKFRTTAETTASACDGLSHKPPPQRARVSTNYTCSTRTHVSCSTFLCGECTEVRMCVEGDYAVSVRVSAEGPNAPLLCDRCELRARGIHPKVFWEEENVATKRTRKTQQHETWRENPLKTYLWSAE